MNEQVKSLMRSSLNGYIDDANEIEKIAKRLFEIKEGELDNEPMDSSLFWGALLRLILFQCKIRSFFLPR